ncbi:hypothetical protein [Acinetobacter wuhouensis]|uniref:DUF4238 domain-containing protein n=1 Tax=Acinetobacter wuhouensis TaxID=1879050 RepID=A0A4Q7APB0_9GAMM|nr:hypothetical protein [Acinetobacter wuhouensis]RZG46969.1 hypothetical protein EXU28_07190 [Acinetobacter wuhouensis]
MFNNKTRNQHYVSQVEQKLNCIDPSVDKKNRRIYKFESLNRDAQEYKICIEDGVKIEKNLTFNDLYSLEIFDDGTRDNFEKYFCKLEEKIESLTNEVLSSNHLQKSILLTLFNAKIMNVIRNPYCILSTINTYSFLSDFIPTDEYLKKYFNKINAMNPNENLLLELDINSEQYKKWLKIIFYMVVPIQLNNGKILNFSTEVIHNIFNPENMCIAINLATHDKEVCLLSDRGHVDWSAALQCSGFGYEFNLTKNAFIHFIFIENNLDNLSKFMHIPADTLANMKKNGIHKLDQPWQKINKCENDDGVFSSYNSRVMYQCYRYFYAADKIFLK